MRTLWMLAALAAPLGAQDKGKGAPHDPCDVKRVVPGWWCGTCKRVLDADGIRSNTGCCKRCDNEPQKIELCRKTYPPYYQASCHPKKKGPKPVS